MVIVKYPLLIVLIKAMKLDVATVSLYPFQPKVSYLRKYFDADNKKFVIFLKRLINTSKKKLSKLLKLIVLILMKSYLMIRMH